LRTVDSEHAAKCPKTYVMWAFVVAGMVSAFVVYLFVSDTTVEFVDSNASTVLPVSASPGELILTEHINEEDDYEKPVCKRLEESQENR